MPFTLMTWIGKKMYQKKGQALIFVLVAVVCLVFIVLWNYDLHKILRVKIISQNAGDAGALAAARWQGIFLNLAGDLNILQALAIDSGNMETMSSISNLQARLCFAGPMVAFMAAQQAAKNNGIYANEDFTRYLQEHANEVRNNYPRTFGDDGELLFPEPYEGCWEEYAGMLEAIANNGVAAGPDNAQFYADVSGGHYLLLPDFYDAIAGMIWCWFYNNAPNLLEDYRNFPPCWWPPLPAIQREERINSEIFSLCLSKAQQQFPAAWFNEILSAVSSRNFSESSLTTNFLGETVVWYVYDQRRWTEWEKINPTGPDAFPVTGPVKSQYNYAGADAAVRIETTADKITPGNTSDENSRIIAWSAAAKPFGSLENDMPPTACPIVLPVFKNVRLIPVDTSSAPYGGGYNIAWRKHVAEHLPEYMENGPQATTDCWYCKQLIKWEDESFRQAGIDWLAANSNLCVLPEYGGGHHRGGGSRRGH